MSQKNWWLINCLCPWYNQSSLQFFCVNVEKWYKQSLELGQGSHISFCRQKLSDTQLHWPETLLEESSVVLSSIFHSVLTEISSRKEQMNHCNFPLELIKCSIYLNVWTKRLWLSLWLVSFLFLFTLLVTPTGQIYIPLLYWQYLVVNFIQTGKS